MTEIFLLVVLAFASVLVQALAIGRSNSVRIVSTIVEVGILFIASSFLEKLGVGTAMRAFQLTLFILFSTILTSVSKTGKLFSLLIVLVGVIVAVLGTEDVLFIIIDSLLVLVSLVLTVVLLVYDFKTKDV